MADNQGTAAVIKEFAGRCQSLNRVAGAQQLSGVEEAFVGAIHLRNMRSIKAMGVSHELMDRHLPRCSDTGESCSDAKWCDTGSVADRRFS